MLDTPRLGRDADSVPIPPCLLTEFPPSRQLLLDVTRRQVDESMLREIAEADYGWKADQHLAALRPIHEQGLLPDDYGWYPGEVLALIRWSNPEDAEHKPGSTGLRGHQMRAFVCAALLQGVVDHERGADGATLAQCLASALVLGDEICEAAARFLTWAVPYTFQERWLFGFGLLVLATRLRSRRFSDADLAAVAAWVLACEMEAFEEFVPYRFIEPPPDAFGLGSGYWRPLAAELLSLAAAIETPDTREVLEFLGAYVADFGWE
jgi:hypothetical protein